MKRRLFNLAVVMSSAILVAGIVFWILSSVYGDEALIVRRLAYRPGTDFGMTPPLNPCWIVQQSGGSVGITHSRLMLSYHDSIAADNGDRNPHRHAQYSVDTFWALSLPGVEPWFKYRRAGGPPFDPYAFGQVNITVPLFLPLLLAAILPSVAVWRRATRGKTRWAKSDADLRATPDQYLMYRTTPAGARGGAGGKRKTTHIFPKLFLVLGVMLIAALGVLVAAFFEKGHLPLAPAALDALIRAGEAPFKAAGNGDISAVRQALQSNPGLISASDEKGETLLHCAAGSGNVELVKLLLADHADIEARDIGKNTPLVWAATSGHLQAAKFLLDNNADVNVKNEYGSTPLHMVASVGREGTALDDMAQLLLDYKADVNARDNEGTTPLQAAVGGDRKAMVKLLLAHGAKINDGSDNGCTALHSAAADGLADMIELLVSHGADINARNSNGESPLDLATFGDTTFPADPFFFHPRRDIVELLRSHKAQYTVFDAAALGDVQYVQNAVMQNPYLVSTKGSRGKMLLHYAAQQEQSEMAEFLIANKAEVDATDRDGRTPLHCAADACRLEVVKLLLANKADVNARDSGGETPLYLAASMPRKDVDVVELLLEHGADVNAKTNDGRTPLYESIRDGPVAEILRQHGGHI